ncbi:MAG TPA: alpha/beta hydrolase [Oscillatoriales cyanobacterium M59_W2019_021]|nr:MAG: alpha/beta hydrolase [Cyanobacteria bacterium J055]HIK31716.1 alpha/beta hydrolase [Oscillatoriales cyanobacterium M4454_W2019_049]HIK49635.1 alpha/beta hydrolase [Oscillatoriales cyanobacterium M59_W2019_021]
MPYLQVRGVDRYYQWILPPEPSAPKPVMVFLHGWGGSGRYWESTARALGDQFDCLLYDLPGFGRSPLSSAALSNYELETYADDLAALLDALSLEKVYLNAHSMGASIATLFLNRYRERVERAILTCSGIFEYNEKEFAAFYRFGGWVVKFRPRWLGAIPGMDKMFMARFLHRPLDRTSSQAFLEDFLMADEEAALGTIYACVSQKAAETMPEEFRQLSVPTLLVSGEFDRIISAAMGKQAAKLNSIVQYTVIPSTGHFPMLEDADTYLKVVREFVNDEYLSNK